MTTLLAGSNALWYVIGSFDLTITKAVSAPMTDDDVAELAEELAASGGRLELRTAMEIVRD